MRALHSLRGELPRLFFYLVVWVVLFSLLLLLTDNIALLPGFVLGAVGSGLYVLLLYRQLAVSLVQTADSATPPSQSSRVARLMIIVAILVISRFAQEISFPAALFGFFSFQVSIFLYAVSVSLYQSFRKK